MARTTQRSPDLLDHYAALRQRVTRLEKESSIGDRLIAPRVHHPDPVAEWLSYPTQVPRDGTWSMGAAAWMLWDAEQAGVFDFTIPMLLRHLVGAVKSPGQAGSQDIPDLATEGWRFTRSANGAEIVQWHATPFRGVKRRAYNIGNWCYPTRQPGMPKNGSGVWSGNASAFTGKDRFDAPALWYACPSFDIDAPPTTHYPVKHLEFRLKTLVGYGRGPAFYYDVRNGQRVLIKIVPHYEWNPQEDFLWDVDEFHRAVYLTKGPQEFSYVAGDAFYEEAVEWLSYDLHALWEYDAPPRILLPDEPLTPFAPFDNAFSMGAFVQATYADVAGGYEAAVRGNLADFRFGDRLHDFVGKVREQLRSFDFAADYAGQSLGDHAFYGASWDGVPLRPSGDQRTEAYEHGWTQCESIPGWTYRTPQGWKGQLDYQVRHGWVHLRGHVAASAYNGNGGEWAAFVSASPDDTPIEPDSPSAAIGYVRGITVTDRNGKVWPATLWRSDGNLLRLLIYDYSAGNPNTNHVGVYFLDGVSYPARNA